MLRKGIERDGWRCCGAQFDFVGPGGTALRRRHWSHEESVWPCEEECSSRGNSKCKGPEVGTGLVVEEQ